MPHGCEARDCMSDPSKTDDAERLAYEAVSDHERRRPLPGRPRANETVALGDTPRHVEDQGEGELGGHLGENVRRVGDDDAPRRGRLEIDVVEPDRVVGHDTELWSGRVEKLAVDPVREHEDQASRPHDSGEQLRSGRRAIRLGYRKLE